MSETPRTDEWIKRMGPHRHLDGFEFAKLLERELELRTAERDGARAERNHYMTQLREELNGWGPWQSLDAPPETKQRVG